MTWYLWVREHLFGNSSVWFANHMASVKKHLVASHLSLFTCKMGTGNFLENPELNFKVLIAFAYP